VGREDRVERKANFLGMEIDMNPKISLGNHMRKRRDNFLVSLASLFLSFLEITSEMGRSLIFKGYLKIGLTTLLISRYQP